MKLILVLIIIITNISEQAYAGSNENCQVVTLEEITLCLPKNWIKIPQKNVDNFKATIAKATGGQGPKIQYAFQEKNSDWFVYPYMIINPTIDANLSKTFRDDPNKLISGIKTSVSELKTTANISGKPFFSKPENTIWIRIDNENIDGGKIVTLTGLHLKPKGLISVAIHSSYDEYNTKEEVFLTTIKSVKIK